MRLFIESFERNFSCLDRRSIRLLDTVPSEMLYTRPVGPYDSMVPFSVGEYILRSAAAAEQAFNGITTRLWDDPFEWTLPEKLATADDIMEYMREVQKTQATAFKAIRCDEDLTKLIPAPAELRPICEILFTALLNASHFQGRAYAIFQTLGQAKLPRL